MPKKEPAQAASESKQTILSHMLALRKVLVYSICAIGIGFVVAFYFFCEPLMGFITKPIVERGVQIIYTAVSEALVTQMKVSLIAGIIIASPVVFFQIWSFVKPALYDNEIRIFRLLFTLALLLFIFGVVFCYVYVYQLAINFFLVAGENLATPMLSIDKYIGFLFSFVVPFGIVFELPVAIYMAARVGIVDYKKLSEWRKYVILAIAVIAAILTPPDVVSQVMLGIPMYLLFEVGVQVARFTKPRRKKEQASSGEEDK